MECSTACRTMQPIHILLLVSCPFFSFGVNIRKCWFSLFSAFVFNKAVSEERGTLMNTRAMCVILKSQPKEKPDHVGASTSRGSGQLSIMSVSAPGHLGKYPHYSFGCLQEFGSVYIQQKIPELCAPPWLLSLKCFT